MYYSNPHFDRAVVLRDQDTSSINSSKHSFILIWNGLFLSLNNEVSPSIFPKLPMKLMKTSNQIFFLGTNGATEIWGIDLSKLTLSEIQDYLGPVESYELRKIAPQIDPEQAALLAYAKGLSTWHKTHAFCGTCGTKTQSQQKGHSRICLNENCSTTSFPRLDPAVIVLIEYKQSNGIPLCLLNMHQLEQGYRCSLFSGFVEIGESLEDAAIREMKEEVNVDVKNITYEASQPWPFPATIMIGLKAEASSTDFKVDNQEIKEAKWFSASEIQQLVDQQKLIISKEGSISKYIIESWVKANL